jgi:hypothetical protein
MSRSAGDAVFRKKLIFTVTAGHTGAEYLAQLLSAVPDLTALHEPEPAFSALTRAVARNPDVARGFFVKLKFPFIAAAPGSIYAETAHGFCKGFFVPLLQIGLRPCLVFLRRPPREVALAHLAHRAVPARTPTGNATLFHPEDANILSVPDWERLTDYQLCFWYALAIEQRQWRYAEFATQLDLPRFDTTEGELDSFPWLAAMLQAFRIDYGPELRRAHGRIAQARPVAKPTRRAPPADLDRQEEEVWERIARAEPELRSTVTARYTPVIDEKIARIRAA